MNILYEYALSDMTRLLEKTVNDFRIAYENTTMQPLFCISNKQFLLMENVAKCCNYQVLNICRHLCVDMCKQMGLNVKEKLEDIEDIDFILDEACVTTGFFVSLNSDYILNVSDKTMRSINSLKVIVLQESIDGYSEFLRPNSYKFRNYIYKDRIELITMKQFFEILGRADYEDFKECVGRYNYTAEQMLGITVSAIPTKKAMEKHKKKIQDELLSYFYEKELRRNFKEKEISDMKRWFEKNYEVLISNADFAKSFISSEWYFNLRVKTDGEIDQTAIVAGYLKSLEQLLCDILIVLSEKVGDKFMLFTNAEGKEKTGKKRLPLNYENQKLVLTMANNILRCISGKIELVFRRTRMTDRVIKYLKQYVDNTRNAYMHKDNIYEWNEIKNIRTKTYVAYFMVLGTCNIDVEKLSHIND